MTENGLAPSSVFCSLSSGIPSTGSAVEALYHVALWSLGRVVVSRVSVLPYPVNISWKARP